MSKFDAFWEFMKTVKGLSREDAETEASSYDRQEYRVFIEPITFDTGEGEYTDGLGFVHNREMKTGLFRVVTRKRDHEAEKRALATSRAIADLARAYYTTSDSEDLFRRPE